MSLVATVKLQPAPEIFLEEKATRFLKHVIPLDEESADAFLFSLEQTADDYSTEFVQSFVVLISSASQTITVATLEMLESLTANCSARVRETLVKADLIPQLINTLNPLSLPFAKAVDIYMNIMKIIANSVWLSTPDGLRQLAIEDGDEQQAVHETVLQQVMAPSEQYLWHLCANQFSIIDDKQSELFLELLANILEICPSYQPTMNFVVNMPVVLTIPSCLTFFENGHSIWYFLYQMNNAQREWNKQGGEVRQMGTTVDRQLRMEGFEDVIEEKLHNAKNGYFGRWIIHKSIGWNKQLGMNVPDYW
ncbi:hypothetical protein BLNAU_3361 [Blattamonas nauphoetae]|uniref:Uncharacterized protein n=1 Tax=Blattamonas nauphoetae TaxID=2049346 RepID=A0ABQ9YCS2_9EUKA|nr:hypothetical protein BLNAU_3361 [Blattamonas nauphoetae]